LVEHATENRSVGGSIPPLGTILIPPTHANSTINQNISWRVKSSRGCFLCARSRSAIRRPSPVALLAIAVQQALLSQMFALAEDWKLRREGTNLAGASRSRSGDRAR
jgi:hypothetical protein